MKFIIITSMQFNLMNRFEYIFDEYAGMNVEHTIGSGLFKFLPMNKIPETAPVLEHKNALGWAEG